MFHSHSRPSTVFFTLVLAISVFSHAQTYSESVFYNFCTQANCTDGYYSGGLLIQAADGNFYGTTSYGGITNSLCDSEMSVGGCGTIFRIGVDGFTTLYSFCSLANCADGAVPDAGLVQGGDGNFYGMTSGGGDAEGCDPGYGCGTAFRITPSGKFTLLATLTSNSLSGLVEGSDGNFYGTTMGATGEGYPSGNVFTLTSAGSLTNLYAFQCSQSICANGGNPTTGLVQGSDGNFYGSTYGGGANGYGTIFKITLAGSLTTLHSINNDTDGSIVSSSLVEGSNGSFYGNTLVGGTHDGGVFFNLTSAGNFSTLYSFCENTCTPMASSPGILTLAGDGKFYSALDAGGNTTCDNGAGSDCYACDDYNCGEAVQMTPGGTFTPIYVFCSDTDCMDGGNPHSMIEASDGNLYGMTLSGGNPNNICNNYGSGQEVECGTIFKIAVDPPLPAPVQVSLSSSSVTVGTPVTASMKVLNAFSLTMQQCYAFQNGSPLGKISGSYNSSTQLYTFSTSFIPSSTGTYNYAVTCGGVESGYATLTVNAYPTTTTLTASPNPVTPPSSDTLTATVKRTGSSAIPTGSVTFYYQTTSLGTAKLNGSGVATLQASSSGITAGTYAITAKYTGDSSDAASTSAPVSVVVK